MIMADKIMDLRKKNGWSQEELANRLGVSRQSVSKWESAQSVPDLGKVVAMADLFGVSTDYLLKDELEGERPALTRTEEAPEVSGNVRWVSLEEANDYLQVVAGASRQIALGVMLCILSAIFPVVLSQFGAMGMIPLSEDRAAVFGTVILLLFVAAAVCLFVKNGMQLSRFDYLEKEDIETAYGVAGMVQERRQAFSQTRLVQMVTGIMLCIVSVVPLLVMVLVGVNTPREDLLACIGVGILLAIVSIGVYLIVKVSMVWGAFQKLLEEGDYTRKTKHIQNGGLVGGYWALVTAAYLAWSFWTMRWERTWIVWPVAGVLYILVYQIARERERGGEER